MGVEIGKIVEGKVSGISKFGAFVDLPDKTTGMIHISEISQSYVNDINDFLKVGDTVKAMVISSENGKIALSIKKIQPKAASKDIKKNPKKSRKPYKPAPPVTTPGDFEWQNSRRETPSSFEDMMSLFKKTSEDKISDLHKASGESRGYSRRGSKK